MRCARVQDRLMLYLAEELEPREAGILRRHLESCPHCSAVAAELAETQDLVASALRTAVTAPAALQARVMAAARREPVRRRRWTAFPLLGSWKQRLAAAAVALSLLAGGYGLGHWHPGKLSSSDVGWVRPGRPTLSLALLGDDHLEYLANPQPAQVPGPDARQVSRRLTSILKFPVAAVDLQSDGARLLGGRKCRVQGVWVAFLLYDWRGERVSLYQMDGRKITVPPLPETLIHGRCFHVGETGGLSYVAWRSGAMQFVMVSGAEPKRLLQLARRASGMSESA